jgi:UDP-3-O-[3-hydroxymyristoyl] glucosamine N-acyltransferase
MFSGQVGIIGHLKIADGTIIAAQSGISKDTKAGEATWVHPAWEASKYRKSYIHFRLKLFFVFRGVTVAW